MKLFNMRAAMIVLRRNLKRYVARHAANRESNSADRVKAFLEAVATHKDVRQTAQSRNPYPNSKPSPYCNPSPNLTLTPIPTLTPTPYPQPGEQDDQELHLQDQCRPADVPLVPVQAARAAQRARAAVRQAGAHIHGVDTPPLMYLPLLHHRYAHPSPDPNPNPNPDPNPNPNPSPNRVQVRTKKSVDAFLTGEDKRQWLELVGDKLLELAKATTTEGKRADKDGAGAKGPKKGKAKGAKGGGGEAGEGGPGSPSKGNLLQIDFDVKITVRLRSGTLAPAPAPAPALALTLTRTLTRTLTLART